MTGAMTVQASVAGADLIGTGASADSTKRSGLGMGCCRISSKTLGALAYMFFFMVAVTGWLLTSRTIASGTGLEEFSLAMVNGIMFCSSSVFWLAVACKNRTYTPTMKDVRLAVPFACMYLFQWYFPVMAMQYVSAAQFNVMMQLRLVTAPVLAYFLGERRTIVQILALGVLLFGVVSIVLPDESMAFSVPGMLFCLSHSILGTLCYGYNQYASAKASNQEIYACIAAVMLVGLNGSVWALEETVMQITPPVVAGDMLPLYWLACVAVELGTTLVTVKVSAVGMSLATAVTVPLTVVLEFFVSGTAVTKHDMLSAMSVAGAAAIYAIACAEQEERKLSLAKEAQLKLEISMLSLVSNV
mmetsp:Transcript_56494/g.128427  ORF Transcript_56494/g.128427 Transcript_56494/m.128427 type:complete len:358 (-) Transcript_56494:234-1307(-)